MLKEEKIYGQDTVVVSNPAKPSDKLAWVVFPSLREAYTDLKKVAIQMDAEGIDWIAKGDRILRPTTEKLREHETDFSGVETFEEISDYDAVTSYKYSDQLSTLLNSLKSTIQKASGQLNAPSKLIVGEKPTGIFSMAHAARGLIRLPEYYDRINDKVVSTNTVEKQNGKFVSIDTNYNPPKIFDVEQRQKGTTTMLKINKKAEILFAGEMMYTKPTSFEGHVLSFATTVKKVYLHRSTDDLKGSGDERYLDLFIPFNASGSVKKEMMIYGALPAILVAKAFEGSGFKIRISYCIASEKNRKTLMQIIQLSDYDDPINYDAIARGGADPRMVRFHGLGLLSTWYSAIFKQDLGSGYGAPQRPEALKALINEYAFWSAKKAQNNVKGYRNENPTLYKIAAVEMGNNAESMKARAIEEFLSIMDELGVQFQQARQFASEAIDRHMEVLKESKESAKRQVTENINKSTLEQPLNTELRMTDRNFAILAGKISESVSSAELAIKELK